MHVVPVGFLRYRHDVNRVARAIDNRRRSNADFRSHLPAAAIIADGLARLEYGVGPQLHRRTAVVNAVGVERKDGIVLGHHVKHVLRTLVGIARFERYKGWASTLP